MANRGKENSKDATFDAFRFHGSKIGFHSFRAPAGVPAGDKSAPQLLSHYGAPIAIGRTGEPDAPCERSGRIIAQDVQTLSAAISFSLAFWML